MSFIAPPPNTIWDQPGRSPADVDTWTGNAEAVDATSAPAQVGGASTTWTTTNAADGTTNQVVLSGESNTLFVGTGQAEIQSIGQGSVIEAVQVLGDGTKIISTGTFGAGGESNNGVAVNTSIQVSGDEIGQTTSISAAAGGLIPNDGFYSYAAGGTGNDLLYGSAFSDFFRGGMSFDSIFTYGGNDLVRGGAGSDEISLGFGDDTIYYTSDQLQNDDIDTVTDFNATAGEVDLLAIDANRVGGYGNFDRIGGFGSNELRITDSDGSVTKVVAQEGYAWQRADIFFVV